MGWLASTLGPYICLHLRLSWSHLVDSVFQVWERFPRNLPSLASFSQKCGWIRQELAFEMQPGSWTMVKSSCLCPFSMLWKKTCSGEVFGKTRNLPRHLQRHQSGSIQQQTQIQILENLGVKVYQLLAWHFYWIESWVIYPNTGFDWRRNIISLILILSCVIETVFELHNNFIVAMT